MCEQIETNYLDGEVVWVKLGSCWWPGEVVGPEKLPPDVLPSFRKPPIAVVKFYQEDTYEYVKNQNSIFKYNCSRKNEFINKGLYMYRTKHGHMEKFPEDVIRAETAVGGDIEILTREEFQEPKKESYAGLFGDSAKKTPGFAKRGKGRPRLTSESSRTPVRKIKEKTDYKVHILLQGSNTPSSQTAEPSLTPSTSRVESEDTEQTETNQEQPQTQEKPTVSAPSTPVASSAGGIYSCHACSFSTTRLNVLILHNKTHSVSFTPYTPSPVRKKPAKPTSKATPTTSKTPKVKRPRKETPEGSSKKSSQAKKRVSEDAKKTNTEAKKAKTDEEIKSSLLADWDDVEDEESNDDSSAMVMAGSPEVAVAAESPAVPTPAELPSAQVPGDISPPVSDKAEPSSDSKYEFCEDEDWSLEADAGRKIPRVTNPSKRKEDAKSLSIDEDDVAREVAELLNKTTVPELPSVPDSLNVEENFPEPSIVKSPDKKYDEPEPSKSSEKVPIETAPMKAIFKTKTFFRSRHSRSQDAIGKYVAEQLNAVERMDMSEGEINGSEAVSSPEARDSPPIEPVKVARLAPKIQLKKMKAEAALQQREKEKHKELETVKNKEITQDVTVCSNVTPPVLSVADNKSQEAIIENCDVKNNEIDSNLPKTIQDVLYPTQEIKPVNEETSDKSLIMSHENKENVVKMLKRTPESKDTFIDTEDDKIETPFTEISAEIDNEPSAVEKSLHQSIEPYMNESTASAVDALLSVSRDADRVTRVISNDLPEELFEDDNKDSIANNSVNGLNEIIDESNATKNVENKQNEINFSKDLQIDFNEDNNSNTNVNNTIQNEEDNKSINDKVVSNFNNEQPEDVKILMKLHTENVPSESDLQIAETLLNLPSTTIQSKNVADHQEIVESPSQVESEVCTEMMETQEDMEVDSQVYDIPEETKDLNATNKTETILNNDNTKLRFETEQEKTENALNAAQSLVQMSESIDHKMNIVESNITKNEKPISETYKANQKNGTDKVEQSVEQKVSLLSTDNTNEPVPIKSAKKFETTSSKLLKILEEPIPTKLAIPKALTTAKQIIIPGKEKILNFDVAKSLSGKSQSPVIIRRAAANKTLLNNLGELTGDKIILSRSNKPQDGSSVQTYTMQAAPETSKDSNTITIIQQKIRKVPKTPTKLQKGKFQTNSNSLVNPQPEPKILNEAANDDAMFDINSMPIVLSDDLLTPESIEKMPIVMSDGNLIPNTVNPPKLVKTKQTVVETEKISVTTGPSKPEVKTLLMNPVTEVSKITTPNILSKSSKLRGGAKPMLVIDKTTGAKKIIVTKTEPPVKEIKQAPTIIQQVTQNTGKGEKFIILPTTNSPRPGRPQKIVIDPQTGKAHVLVSKGPEPTISIPENKPVSAKLIPSSSSNANAPGNTVMIITNAQGAQSRIVLTPEHEKILFPNKQQPNMSQLKAIAQRASPSSANVQKTIINTSAAVKTQTKIVPKQKSTIITSKGQLIVGGRVTSTAQSVPTMQEIRPSPKRILAAEPKKVIQKPASEPLIFLQQKSGAVVQLTASQFEHFKRTGQIVQKTPAPVAENKIIVQKTKTISPNETSKPRIRKTATESPMPPKKLRQEIAIAPAPAPAPSLAPVPALAALSNSGNPASLLQATHSAGGTIATSTYPDLDNFEELLPSTAIVRSTEPVPRVEVPSPALRQEVPAPAPPRPEAPAAATQEVPEPAPAPLSDGQLLAVPGEHFGGPPGSFYLCVEENGTLTPIDNRPLVLENNQLVPMAVEPLPVLAPQPERRDILEAALANSDVFHADTPRDDAPDFRDLNANVSVHCRVSETSTTLNQPIMTPVEVPSKGDSEPTVPSNLEDGLAVIGVTPHTVPTSLELPITVTDPRIAPKTTDPLSGTNYGTTLLPSPNTEMTFVTTEEVEMSTAGPISMPLLTDDESVGKSMPILTDEVAERTVSSLSSSSLEAREAEEEGAWSRRLLTPGSDSSSSSAEIPLQPAIQLSVNDLSRHS
ncbi:titin [Amyelois transitella]|uniref:titin n=1 Tax=Amyelois transitella TaxID=680683 RepID=UPI00298FD998|nr:titin [Amyelois transitella]